MMKKYVGAALLTALCIPFLSHAQYAEDALRYSEMNQTGSARFQALGGNHAALGGDPSSIHGNPAGLGFYSRSEFTFSPGLTSINTKGNYLGQSYSNSKSLGNISQASLVIASQPGFQRRWKRSSLGISFSRQQSFHDTYNYGGLNNRSAYVDKVVADANGKSTPVSQLEADFEANGSVTGGPVAYSVPAAYYQMYLINPSGTSGFPYSAVDKNSVVNQFGTLDASGANTQWTIAYAGNLDDKFYIGGNIGFSRLRYKYTRTFEDSYVDSPELISVSQGEGLDVTGSGINLSLGVIYKFSPMFQLGGTIMSPTFTSIKETFTQNVSAQYVDGKVTGPDGTLITPPYTSLPIAPNDFEYSMTSPFRGNLGATVFLQNKGFITGTVEYVGYSGMSVRTKYLNDTDNQAFKTDTKNEITDSFRNAVNFRLGAEYRANLMRFRVGGAYLMSPYQNSDGIQRDKFLVSAGLGVRGNKFFADLSGSLAMYESAFTPYTLSNVQDYSSVRITNKPVNAVLTLGMLF
ncbi:OmpP1/FadL family transporter [Dyadobacter luticola]|uniref:Aromatic hydrocarbon degradation protein n=1 Tax=Dyadobacter luticola TaxID=1979387 RepID=A0A5R9L247_9BACT|nr:hypothetical protein [Dyadobacter luticola]TLV02636.1 hypothetical protein FEN17_03160 [Dyadobacter luticola]